MTNIREEIMEQKTKNFREIEDIIAKAIKKVGGRKENDLCKYLPMTSGGYMHHFTLRKMKNKQPSELGSLIERFIINSDRPSSVPPKQRAARGSRKKRDQVSFTRNQLERMLNIARLAGDKEMISILSPKKSLTSAKRELIASIRHGKVEQELWNSYVECINAHNNLSLNQESFNSFQSR
ncbi:MAG TPA: hypothetical protein VLG76_08615 [Rhabdochlamydiaceae bacterium]|nr:hypothetical protein [Rhabdochlamydiaceae bacterium]